MRPNNLDAFLQSNELAYVSGGIDSWFYRALLRLSSQGSEKYRLGNSTIFSDTDQSHWQLFNDNAAIKNQTRVEIGQKFARSIPKDGSLSKKEISDL